MWSDPWSKNESPEEEEDEEEEDSEERVESRLRWDEGGRLCAELGSEGLEEVVWKGEKYVLNGRSFK